MHARCSARGRRAPDDPPSQTVAGTQKRRRDFGGAEKRQGRAADQPRLSWTSSCWTARRSVSSCEQSSGTLLTALRIVAWVLSKAAPISGSLAAVNEDYRGYQEDDDSGIGFALVIAVILLIVLVVLVSKGRRARRRVGIMPPPPPPPMGMGIGYRPTRTIWRTGPGFGSAPPRSRPSSGGGFFGGSSGGGFRSSSSRSSGFGGGFGGGGHSSGGGAGRGRH